MPDGSVVLVEIAAGTLTRISAEGEHSVIAELGGGPNGAAIGPDGRCYVWNNGGMNFVEEFLNIADLYFRRRRGQGGQAAAKAVGV